MSLKTEVNDLLNRTARLCGGVEEAKPLLNLTRELKVRLEEPLRVAVVGIMKAGKSTFMNALMGKDVLQTGTLETTYTVGWFKYGKSPRLEIHFRDGEIMEAPFSELSIWSVRTGQEKNDRLNDVKYVIIYYPSEILKKIEFIDTPGLNSVYGTDAQNTLDFLNLQSSEDTLSEVSHADAIIYAFSRSAAGFDKEILEAFHKNASRTSSPINSIGLLTKVDASGIWDIYGDTTPVETAKLVADTVMKNEEIKKMLFSVYPVCAKTVEGYAKLQNTDWELLEQLSAAEEEELADELFDAGEFIENCTLAGSETLRKSLIDKIGQYGILEAVRQRKAGKTEEQIQAILRESCGLKTVQEILSSHFGGRTFLIKSQYIFRQIKAMTVSLKKGTAYNSQIRSICGQVEEDIENLMSSVQTLNELKVLQMYYNGQVIFKNPEDKQDFLMATGEQGRNIEMRLGMPFGTTVSELKEEAGRKVSKWRALAGDFMQERNFVSAAGILARTYENMFYHLSALEEE